MLEHTYNVTVFLNCCFFLSLRQFNFSRLNDPEYCYEEPYAQPLGGTKPIIGVGMEQLTIHTTVTAMLVVESYDTGDYIEYFLGDREGNVHRVGIYYDRTISCFIL